MKMKKLLYWLIVLPLLASILLPATPVRAQSTEILRPNDVGTLTNWTAFGAANNWECVNEVPSDNDTTYVTTSGNNIHDSYNLQDHTTGSGTISNVRVYARAKSLTAGKILRLTVVVGGTEDESADITLTDAYVDYYADWAQNPVTSANWTWTEIDALEAGFRNTVAGKVEHRVTTVWVVVTYTLPPVDILNTPSEWNFGTVDPNSEYTTGITYQAGVSGFRITNNVAYDVNITISASDMGSGWLLADSGDPDATHYTLWAGTELTSGLYNIQVTSGGVPLITVLASSTRDWGLKLMTPTSFADGGQKSGTVTLTATQA